MVEIETLDDIADEIADKLGIYNEEDSERSFFVADLTVRMREAYKNEKMLWGEKGLTLLFPHYYFHTSTAITFIVSRDNAM